MEGRWTIQLCNGCGRPAMGRSAAEICPDTEDSEIQRPVPVVPCDDAAVERGAERIDDLLTQLGVDPAYAPDHAPLETVKRVLARAVLSAAGEPQ